MDDRERGKAMLEKLRVRTVSRGATPAEAAAAAELVDKICRRYGLDKPVDDKSACDRACASAGQQLEERRCPSWAMNLGLAIALRFRCRGEYTRLQGERSTVIFTGEEHLVSVAQWMFGAIYQDLRRRSHYAALAHNQASGKRLHFRTLFCESATWEVVRRMQVPRPEVKTGDLTTEVKLQNEVARPRKARPCKPLTAQELVACFAGRQAGREVSVDTNAVGDRRGQGVALIGCGS